jgi:PST family polysaccharide transporter
VCCASLVVNGLGVVHAALLRRDLQYRKLAFIEGGAMLFGLAAGLTGAFLWRDVWALVAGYIAQVLWASVTALLLCPWVPGRPRRTNAVIDLSFSFQVTLYNVLTYAGNNVSLAAGYRFGAADLGFFNRGQQLCHLAQFAFLTPITEVGFGLLCRLARDRTYTHAYIALARRVSVLFIPFASVLPIVSGDLTLALLGPAWAPASPILAWFALAIFGQAFASLSAQVMTSQGRGPELRNWAVGNLIVRAAGAVVGSQFGVVGMAAGFSLATFFLAFPLMVRAGWSGPVKLRDQLVAMWPGVLLAVPAALGAALAVLGADALSLSAGWARLSFVGGSAALVWAVVCLLLRPARDALFGRGMARE